MKKKENLEAKPALGKNWEQKRIVTILVAKSHYHKTKQKPDALATLLALSDTTEQQQPQAN